jgi:hypothetical protein
MSGQTYLTPSRILKTMVGHIRPLSFFPELTKHIRLLGQIPEVFLGHVSHINLFHVLV